MLTYDQLDQLVKKIADEGFCFVWRHGVCSIMPAPRWVNGKPCPARSIDRDVLGHVRANREALVEHVRPDMILFDDLEAPEC